jgi:hypothetical protein
MDKPTCFVIMPITTPEQHIKSLSGGEHHFKYVYDHLFKPAIEKAGFEPLPPKMSGGSDMIQPGIIQKLNNANLVLCDLSILNPNVFFELGIRTALNKPVCLVKDEQTRQIPFDIGDLNCHSYSSLLNVWEADEMEKLTDHISKTKPSKENQLWKYFGISGAASSLPTPSETDKLGYIISILEVIRNSQNQPPYLIAGVSRGVGYQGIQGPFPSEYGSHTTLGAQSPHEYLSSVAPGVYRGEHSRIFTEQEQVARARNLEESKPSKKQNPKQ